MPYSIRRIMFASLVLALFAMSASMVAQADTTNGDTVTDPAIVATAKKESYGHYLVDSNGMSLYLFKADAQAQGSTCYKACAKTWPPLLTTSKPMAKDMAKQKLLGTIERKNGDTQVTYNGWPLYRFINDEKPGDTLGQDMKGFGGEWYLVTPKGKVLSGEGDGSENGG